MRYKIISLEVTTGEQWVNANVASTRHASDAIAIANRVSVPCYVQDSLEGRTIYTKG
jgi:hypothetical protein